MLKGYRTYISIVCALIANSLPMFTNIPRDISDSAVTLLLALAAYFRFKA